MINKVENLVSIGKFRNYQATGPVNFKKLTLIYGDNGGGKTTLTSVFRSLTTNNPEIIRNRISTNSTTAQAAQITQIGTPNIFHTFGAVGWTVQFPDIEIFDIYFVNENIYSGFDFSDEHRKQLHQFVIGAQGVAIQNQMEQNKIDKTNSKQNQANIISQLIQQVGNNLTENLINAFLTIPATQANNIDQQIATAEAVLASANSNAVIQTLQPLSTLARITTGIDFASIIADLQTTSQTIQNAVLETLYSQHCQDLSANTLIGPENWLQKGFTYVENKQTIGEPIIFCPFCKQSIDTNSDILNAYASKFNADFNALVQRLQAYLLSLQNFNLEAAIQAINNVNQTNTGRITSWATHLPNTVLPPTFNIIADEDDLKVKFQNLIASVQQKIQNPTVAVATATATVFQNLGQTINSNIDSYNQSVTVYNTEITTFRSGIQTVVVAQLEVDRLKRIKKRFEASIDTLCNQLIAEKQVLRNLESVYTQLSQQQQAAATTFFNNYQTRINHYLGNVFKTHFRIENVVHVPPRGRATQSQIGYKLTIDGNDISFIPNQPFNAKECLSEGDKSTIALAFFLSKLDIDPNIQDKILIFDDPLSSLDTNRRAYTIGIIKSLFQQLKQVVVLSHNEFFLHEIGKDIGSSYKCTLRIIEDFVARASKIEICDLDELVKIDYFKHIERLEAFRSNPDINLKDSVLGWLRNVLEAHLRFKFYREIRTMTGQQTFGRLISFLNTSPVTFRDNVNRTDIISKLNLINGVSWKSHHGDPNPDYTTLGVNPNSITIAELDNLIEDTLDLIETRL
ncbi:MAG: AAA family ATPase [Petrimonas sp.]|uniref:AAA family ATPase n=1 Tax=Petrimonas sp. TaxID=2023866 RepID=UPI002B3FB96E|nr:AAA family ATPase [Petrimonas sp.]MEA5045122.1 AAA family ATPase [Petrimonas sp.]